MKIFMRIQLCTRIELSPWLLGVKVDEGVLLVTVELGLLPLGWNSIDIIFTQCPGLLWSFESCLNL